jgi:UDP-N-acetylmuramate: L-alanyl-gamma-D-glutamyl-meso-diaminopimelate ligase
MHIHILGIAGTFMGGLASLAQEKGHDVSGSDLSIYPPMSDVLARINIKIFDSYSADNLRKKPDLVLIGNALSRGNECVEFVLTNNIPYMSGPEWLKKEVLPGRHVIAVSGTHGKTTVTSMIAWILENSGLSPGFLIGGVPGNFSASARIGKSKYFVIEADEYDTAFFDKRSKFVHYQPRTLIINNLEFDHADIFENLDSIKKQFHHLIRTMPAEATIIHPEHCQAINDTVKMGCWSQIQTFGISGNCDWKITPKNDTSKEISIVNINGNEIKAECSVFGTHNENNMVAAMCAVASLKERIKNGLSAMKRFKNVRRRLEFYGEHNGIQIFDDFAHHPTAIKAAIDAVKNLSNERRLIAIVEFRSNSLIMGANRDQFVDALENADEIFILLPQDCSWDVRGLLSGTYAHEIHYSPATLVGNIMEKIRHGDTVLSMSNSSSAMIPRTLMGEIKAL